MRVKLTHPNARLPHKGNYYDAGADLFSTVDVVIPANGTAKINLGIQLEIPVGHVGYIVARSGISTKHGIRPINCVGVIDCDYRGDVCVTIENASGVDYRVSVGDRIVQLIIQRVEYTSFELSERLTETFRGDCGFGSTGK